MADERMVNGDTLVLVQGNRWIAMLSQRAVCILLLAFAGSQLCAAFTRIGTRCPTAKTVPAFDMAQMEGVW